MTAAAVPPPPPPSPRPQHPLLGMLLDAADGRFPAADGGVTVLPAMPDGQECSVAFTGHAVIATARPEAAVCEAPGPPDGLGGSLAPDFLRWLAGPRGRIVHLDVTLVARGTGDDSAPRLPERHDLDRHPRVRLAQELRTDVRVHGDERGLITLADGLAGRRELGIELIDGSDGSDGSDGHGPGQEQGRGHGRALLRDALTLVPSGEPVFAAIAPGNARSLRSFLAAGFTPVGSEVVIIPDPERY
ncbi:hypothetical protein LHJ74_21820 [Streptomyces sp. N2-109]|uniref:N-acetyltransferase domain-containing protein n=1 Tax=Streptomyces gossypii TaxID=2883101 RepID=A0ABT2JX88_9ACTN|nr:hypothetical protein [Streptomyces gossypii]MCT2592513.1 hypothetical protein [Streptomyces gossypii]